MSDNGDPTVQQEIPDDKEIPIKEEEKKENEEGDY